MPPDDPACRRPRLLMAPPLTAPPPTAPPPTAPPGALDKVTDTCVSSLEGAAVPSGCESHTQGRAPGLRDGCAGVAQADASGLPASAGATTSRPASCPDLTCALQGVRCPDVFCLLTVSLTARAQG